MEGSGDTGVTALLSAQLSSPFLWDLSLMDRNVWPGLSLLRTASTVWYAAWRHYNRDGKGGSTSTGFYLKLKKEKKEKVVSNQVLYFSQSIGD